MLLLSPLGTWAHGAAPQITPHAAAAAVAAPPLDPLARSVALPDISARFRVTLIPRYGQTLVQQWQLSRAVDEIGWIKGHGVEEIWRRDASGVRLARVLRHDRHVIDYSAGELRALGVAPDWDELACLFSESALLWLKPAGRHQPGQAQHWHGRIGGDRIDLRWDPVARLPLRLARSSPRGQVLYERLALHPSAPADWPRAAAGSDDFQRLDAADFGDMAQHPVVARARALDQRAGWRQGHAD